jgi:2-oxoglutarate/2-oxoacid ferredoxin oxidoreductase subunit beta
VLRAAAAHRGTSFVEIYQNCPIFNDGAFDALKDSSTSADAIIPLTHGEPIRFGVDGHLGVVRDPRTGEFRVVEVGGPDGVDESALAVHDAHVTDPSYAFGLSRLTDAGVLHRAPIGIFRDVDAPAYDDLAREQVALAAAERSGDADALQSLINGGDTWMVS